MNRTIQHGIYVFIFFLAGLIACDLSYAQMGGFGGMSSNRSSSSRSSGSSNTNVGSRYTPGQAWQALIETDAETKSIIVVGDDDANERIKEIIQSLDKPVPQVLIKVVFVEVTHNNDVDLGFEGSIRTKRSGAGENLKSAFGVASQTTGGFFSILEKDLDVTLRALSEIGKMEVLSRPSIMTRNSQEATITVGQKVPMIQNSRITDQGQTINTVTYESIGIILVVTPYITSDGLVEMTVAPEISALTGDTVPISDTINAPVYALRSASTQVVVPDGITVVIGGLMQDNNTESVKKIPGLGDIPLLGAAFRRTVKSKEKTELLIFLTPHVVQGNAQLAKLSNSEKNNMELVPQVFSDKQMQKYMEPSPDGAPDQFSNTNPTQNQEPAIEKKTPAKENVNATYPRSGSFTINEATDTPAINTNNSVTEDKLDQIIETNKSANSTNTVIKKPLTTTKKTVQNGTTNAKKKKSTKERTKRLSPNKE